MALESLMYETDDDLYYESDFLDLLDSHLHVFMTDSGNRTIPCAGHVSGRHEGDLNGFLDHNGIPKKFHYLIMRMNGLTHTGDLLREKEEIIIPNLNIVDQLAQVYKNKKL